MTGTLRGRGGTRCLLRGHGGSGSFLLQGPDRVVHGERAQGRLDVQVLEHPAVVADDPAAPALLPGPQDAARVVDRLLGRRERRVRALDLSRMDQRLAVEAELATLPALGEEAVGVLHVVVDAVEDRGARGARGEEAEAQPAE